MKKTFQELVGVDQMVGKLYAENPNLKETKFGYAYTKFYNKNYKPTSEKYFEELTDKRIDLALEDPNTKEILKDFDPQSRGYKYSKESTKQIVKFERELSEKYHEMEIEIEPYYSAYLPELTEFQREMLMGLLIEAKEV